MKILAVVTLTLALSVGISAQSKTRDLKDLNWMVGCWESHDRTKGLFLSEQWMKPAGDLMLGIGRTVRGGKAVDFEFMRIEKERVDIFFIARPRENKEDTSFMLVKWGRSEVVFENPAHDFPQRVIYKRSGTKLIARVEGKSDGKLVAIDYPMTRARCE